MKISNNCFGGTIASGYNGVYGTIGDIAYDEHIDGVLKNSNIEINNHANIPVKIMSGDAFQISLTGTESATSKICMHTGDDSGKDAFAIDIKRESDACVVSSSSVQCTIIIPYEKVVRIRITSISGEVYVAADRLCAEHLCFETVSGAMRVIGACGIRNLYMKSSSSTLKVRVTACCDIKIGFESVAGSADIQIKDAFLDKESLHNLSTITGSGDVDMENGTYCLFMKAKTVTGDIDITN